MAINDTKCVSRGDKSDPINQFKASNMVKPFLTKT